MTRPALVALALVAVAATAVAAPSPKEVKDALDSKDAARIRALLGQLRGELDAASVRAVLDAGEAIHAAGVYEDTVEVLATAHGDALTALADGYGRARRNPSARFLVLDALARVQDPIGPKTLADAAKGDSHPGVAVYAVRLLGRRGDARSVEALIEVLKDARGERAGVAREAESTLGGLAGQDLRGHDAWSRWWAEAKGSWGRGAAAPAGGQAGGGDGTRTRTVIDRLRERRPGDLRTLERLGRDEILVFEAEFDRVQNVLASLKLPHQVHPRASIETVALHPRRQVLVFNCAGDALSPAACARIRQFVCQGGYIFTSDWELGNLLVKAFPEAAVSGGRRSAEHNVRIYPPQTSSIHPLLRDVFPLNPWEAEQRKLTWAVDGASEFFQPNAALTVLAEAPELQPLYGSTIVAATFAYGPDGRPVTGDLRRRAPRRQQTGGGTRERGPGDGEGEVADVPHVGRVLHVVSHFQHQTSESGDGFALQQLLLNFIVEKQEARRGN